MNNLNSLLAAVNDAGGEGKIFRMRTGVDALIFFLSLQGRVYVAKIAEEGYVFSVVRNTPNRSGGMVSAFGHYCLPLTRGAEPYGWQRARLSRIDDFYGFLQDEDFFDLREELRNNDIDLFFQNIACELGYTS